MNELQYENRIATYYDKSTNEKVTFQYPDGTIFVAISGGLDSTLLINLICVYITDLKLENSIRIVPFHSVSKQLSNSLEITQSILDDVVVAYPNVNIEDLEVWFYDEDDIVKNDAMFEFYHHLFEKYENGKLITNGLSSLPKEAKNWPTYLNLERYNQVNQQDWYKEGIHLYRPFAKHDKKMIASMFHYLRLPKRYIRETWSCTYYADYTKTFTEPCGLCYHCHEKRWAFGEF